MLNKKLPAGTADEKTTEDEVPTSRPTIGNTIVVGSQSSVSPNAALNRKQQLEALFDKTYGELDGSTVLSHEEYNKHKEWSINSGFFEFQLSRQLYQSTDE